MDVTHIVMPGTASFEDVRGEIDRLARLWNVHGIMVEQPLPEHLKPFRLDIWRTIRPHKVQEGGREGRREGGKEEGGQGSDISIYGSNVPRHG